jgi:hypothetical protein
LKKHADQGIHRQANASSMRFNGKFSFLPQDLVKREKVYVLSKAIFLAELHKEGDSNKYSNEKFLED